MKNKSYKLVSGTFNKEDARRIMLSLVNSKINFHSLEAFRKRETGVESNLSNEIRLKELLETKKEIMDWIDPLPDSNTQISIKGLLEVTHHD